MYLDQHEAYCGNEDPDHCSRITTSEERCLWHDYHIAMQNATDGWNESKKQQLRAEAAEAALAAIPCTNLGMTNRHHPNCTDCWPVETSGIRHNCPVCGGEGTQLAVLRRGESGKANAEAGLLQWTFEYYRDSATLQQARDAIRLALDSSGNQDLTEAKLRAALSAIEHTNG